MTYILITSKGQIFQFFLKAVADSYQLAYGGVVFTQQILTTETTVNEHFGVEE